MRTCLGASLELQKGSQLPSRYRAACWLSNWSGSPAEISMHVVGCLFVCSWADGITLLHCEGYALYRPALTKELTLAAKEKGALVSIDLASFEVRSVHASRPVAE